MTTYFSARELLAPPTERAAFSDRQAYVCAELSKLAYFKFEGGHTLEQALDVARKLLNGNGRLALLEEQLRVVLSSAPSSAAEGEEALKKILQGALEGAQEQEETEASEVIRDQEGECPRAGHLPA